MSKGIIEGDHIIVESGPLKGYEGFIKKIDRHKRIAFIDVELFNTVTTVKVGLEIVSKFS
jgi:transcriptional antiterminator NusG